MYTWISPSSLPLLLPFPVQQVAKESGTQSLLVTWWSAWKISSYLLRYVFKPLLSPLSPWIKWKETFSSLRRWFRSTKETLLPPYATVEACSIALNHHFVNWMSVCIDSMQWEQGNKIDASHHSGLSERIFQSHFLMSRLGTWGRSSFAAPGYSSNELIPCISETERVESYFPQDKERVSRFLDPHLWYSFSTPALFLFINSRFRNCFAVSHSLLKNWNERATANFFKSRMRTSAKNGFRAWSV